MKKLWSIFTDDMNKCIVTSAMTSIDLNGGCDGIRTGIVFRT